MRTFVAVVLISAGLAPSLSAAASPNAQPMAGDAVERLPAGARLKLVLADGSIATGTLVRVENDAITLADTSLVRKHHGSTAIRNPRSFPLGTIASVEEAPRKRMSGLAKVVTVGAIAGGVVVGYYLWLLANSR